MLISWDQVLHRAACSSESVLLLLPAALPTYALFLSNKYIKSFLKNCNSFLSNNHHNRIILIFFYSWFVLNMDQSNKIHTVCLLHVFLIPLLFFSCHCFEIETSCYIGMSCILDGLFTSCDVTSYIRFNLIFLWQRGKNI